MAATSRKVIDLYKLLVRESQKFSHYSYREYTLRKVRESFREHMLEKNADKLALLLQQAESELQVIRRQVIINQLYPGKPLVIESTVKSHSTESQTSTDIT